MESSSNLKCAICAYQNNEDEEMICAVAAKYGFKVEVTKGYMYYPESEVQQYHDPALRRGIVRLVKTCV